MKVTVYVNWNEHKVFSEDEYKKELNRRIEKFCADDANFEDWLDANYTALELYNLENDQKEKIRKAFLEDARDAEEDGGFGWDCEDFTLEI